MTKAKPLFNKEFCSQSCPYLTNPSTMTVGGDTAYYYSCSKYPEGWQRLSDPDNIKRCDDCIKANKPLRKIVKNKLSPSEAVMGFIAWLTTRPEVTTMSSSHECGGLVELYKKFVEANNLGECRSGYENCLKFPKEND